MSVDKKKYWENSFTSFNILHIGQSSNMDLALESDPTSLSINHVNRWVIKVGITNLDKTEE